MTESEWLASEDPAAMLGWVEVNRRHRRQTGMRDEFAFLGTDRKLRLFICAVARKLEDTPPHPERTAVIQACETIADGGSSEWGPGETGLRLARESIDSVWGWIWAASWEDLGYALRETLVRLRGNAGSFYGQGEAANLLREIVGNPFRPVAFWTDHPETGERGLYVEVGRRPVQARWSGVEVSYALASWLTSDVLALAQAAYEHRLPSGTLDPYGLALLADALEEAGCDHPDILDHLRSPGPHVRGCWALDLVLGKE